MKPPVLGTYTTAHYLIAVILTAEWIFSIYVWRTYMIDIWEVRENNSGIEKWHKERKNPKKNTVYVKSYCLCLHPNPNKANKTVS